MNKKFLFKPRLTEEDMCKILHISMGELNNLVVLREAIGRYKDSKGFFFMPSEVLKYVEKNERAKEINK